MAVSCKTCKRMGTAWIDPQSGRPTQYCSETCFTVCLNCHINPRAQGVSGPASLFCSNTCLSLTTGDRPGIIEIPESHKEFEDVSEQFDRQWRHKVAKKKVKKVYFVILDRQQMANYNAHKEKVESNNHTSASRQMVEMKMWHGTARICLLGNPGNTQLCEDAGCGVCGIIESSFDLGLYKGTTGWGRFGRAIYSSATSSKAATYSKSPRVSTLNAMLLATVVVGNPEILYQDSPDRTQPSPGYDSVLGKPGGGGRLNYDECVVYTNDAIRPAYLVMYE